MEKLINDIVKQLENKGVKNPEIAIILGSGLADMLDELSEKVYIPFYEIDGMPMTKVQGHKNQFIFGKFAGKSVLAMQGRFHLYDGFTAKEVSLPIYIFKKLGVKTLIVTNASGSVNYNIREGDIMLITDHINLTGTNSMIGGAVIDYGEQFIDMSEPYNKKLMKLAEDMANKNQIQLKKGAYAQVIGPFYETKPQCRLIVACGCSAVGMSTVIEVETAVQCGIDVLGLSVITDMSLKEGNDSVSTTHEAVLERSKLASKKLATLIFDVISHL